jgi:hypothetical protein
MTIFKKSRIRSETSALLSNNVTDQLKMFPQYGVDFGLRLGLEEGKGSG